MFKCPKFIYFGNKSCLSLPLKPLSSCLLCGWYMCIKLWLKWSHIFFCTDVIACLRWELWAYCEKKKARYWHNTGCLGGGCDILFHINNKGGWSSFFVIENFKPARSCFLQRSLVLVFLWRIFYFWLERVLCALYICEINWHYKKLFRRCL